MTSELLEGVAIGVCKALQSYLFVGITFQTVEVLF